MLKVASDVDEVWFPWIETFLKYVRDYGYNHFNLQKLGIPKAFKYLEPSDITEWDFYAEYGVSRELFLTLYFDYLAHPLSYHVRPHDGYETYLNVLAGKVKTHFITARPTIQNLRLWNWFKLYEIPFEEIIFIGGDGTFSGSSIDADGNVSIAPFNDKRKYFTDGKFDVAIDDNPTYICQAYESGVPHIFLVSKPHNMDFNNEAYNVIRVNGIGDAANKILQLACITGTA